MQIEVLFLAETFTLIRAVFDTARGDAAVIATEARLPVER